MWLLATVRVRFSWRWVRSSARENRSILRCRAKVISLKSRDCARDLPKKQDSIHSRRREVSSSQVRRGPPPERFQPFRGDLQQTFLEPGGMLPARYPAENSCQGGSGNVQVKGEGAHDARSEESK